MNLKHVDLDNLATTAGHDYSPTIIVKKLANRRLLAIYFLSGGELKSAELEFIQHAFHVAKFHDKKYLEQRKEQNFSLKTTLFSESIQSFSNIPLKILKDCAKYSKLQKYVLYTRDNEKRISLRWQGPIPQN